MDTKSSDYTRHVVVAVIETARTSRHMESDSDDTDCPPMHRPGNPSARFKALADIEVITEERDSSPSPMATPESNVANSLEGSCTEEMLSSPASEDFSPPAVRYVAMPNETSTSLKAVDIVKIGSLGAKKAPANGNTCPLSEVRTTNNEGRSSSLNTHVSEYEKIVAYSSGVGVENRDMLRSPSNVHLHSGSDGTVNTPPNVEVTFEVVTKKLAAAPVNMKTAAHKIKRQSPVTVVPTVRRVSPITVMIVDTPTTAGSTANEQLDINKKENAVTPASLIAPLDDTAEDASPLGDEKDSKDSPSSDEDNTAADPDYNPVGRCGICKEVFNDMQSLRTHMASHTGPNAFVCKTCSASYATKEELATHLATHEGRKPLKCPFCTMGYSSRQNFLSHVCTHTGEMAYECMLCPEAYSRRRDLTEHMLCHNGERPYKCKVCPKSFLREYDLNNHMYLHNGNKPFACTQCSKTYLKRNDLNNHMFVHSGTKPYQCTQCPKGYSSHKDLRNHLLGHEGKKPHQCPHCPKAFLRQADLEAHSYVHSGQRPYQCPVCPKSYIKERDLTNHMFTHTGQKPNQCHLCPKSYLRRRDYDSHMAIHAGVKTLECQECGKVFLRRNDLTDHMYNHTGEKPFKCTLCPKSYIRRNDLNSHMCKHTGEKPFVCPVCSKGFTLKSALRKHKFTHLEKPPKSNNPNDRPFQCDLCGDKFWSYSGRSRHHQRKHLNYPPRPRPKVIKKPSKKPKPPKATKLPKTPKTPKKLKTPRPPKGSGNAKLPKKPRLAKKLSDAAAEVSVTQCESRDAGVLDELNAFTIRELVEETLCRSSSIFYCVCGVMFMDFALYRAHSSFHHPDVPTMCACCEEGKLSSTVLEFFEHIVSFA